MAKLLNAGMKSWKGLKNRKKTYALNIEVSTVKISVAL